MPTRKDVLHDFIDDIPDHRLESVRDHQCVVIKDGNFHLDVQGKTTNGQLNLQIQCVKRPVTKSLRGWARHTVAGPAFVPADEDVTPKALREAFKESSVDFNDTSQQRGKGTRRKTRPNAEEKTEEPDQGEDKEKQDKKGKGKNKFGKW